MKNNDLKAVFFDCWSTVISFAEKQPDWNTAPLKRHAKNNSDIDWAKVDSFSCDFFDRYYATTKFEIKYNQFLNLIITLFHIEIDCPLSELNHEVFQGLDPKPIKGIEAFLSYLTKHGLYHAILSNTIYEDADSFSLVKRLIPSSDFGYFFGSSNVGVKKPDSVFFQTAVKPSGFLLEQSMYIGDTFYQDVFGSYSAGFRNSVWINTRKKKKEAYSSFCDISIPMFTEVSDYDELISLFEKGVFDK